MIFSDQNVDCNELFPPSRSLYQIILDNNLYDLNIGSILIDEESSRETLFPEQN